MKQFIIRQISLAIFVFDIVVDRELNKAEIRDIVDKI